jgi:hypothetical protein
MGASLEPLGHRHSCMVAAQSAVNRRLKELRIPFAPMVVGGMFAAATASTGSYGCEIWSTPCLGTWHLLAGQCKLQSYQAAVYKQCVGVPGCTPNLLVFFEMGRNPLQIQWLARTWLATGTGWAQPAQPPWWHLCGQHCCGPGLRPHQRVGGRAARCPAVCVPRTRLDGTHASGSGNCCSACLQRRVARLVMTLATKVISGSMPLTWCRWR